MCSAHGGGIRCGHESGCRQNWPVVRGTKLCRYHLSITKGESEYGDPEEIDKKMPEVIVRVIAKLDELVADGAYVYVGITKQSPLGKEAFRWLIQQLNPALQWANSKKWRISTAEARGDLKFAEHLVYSCDSMYEAHCVEGALQAHHSLAKSSGAKA